MKKRSIFAIILSTALIVGLLVGFKHWNEYRVSRSSAAAAAISSLVISFEEDGEGEPIRVFEYGDGIIKTRDLVKYNGGELYIDVDEIDCNKVGTTEVTYLMTTKDEFGRDFSNSEVVKYEVKDTAMPEIKIIQETIDIPWGGKIDPLNNVLFVKDKIDGDLENSEELKAGTFVVESDIDTETSGTYEVKVKAMDKNGNLTEDEFRVIVGEKPVEPEPVEPENPDNTENPEDENSIESVFNGKPYQIRVNTATNILTIYTVGEDGRYSSLFRINVCSVARDAELGKFYTGAQWEWVGTYGDVFAQYATQFAPGTLIQSAPYNTQNPADLRWEDYNMLGSNANTHGSVWLSVADAKWIYDNVGAGTEVVFYSNYELGGLFQPAATYIDPESPNRGWDPTDPNSANPW